MPDYVALIKEFNDADNYHLMLCRGTWLGAIRAYRHESDERVAHAVRMLAYALAIPQTEALTRVEQANRALAPYPMPAAATYADSDPTWDLFLRLVLFTQADDDRAAVCSQLLARQTTGSPSASWWRERARAYAPLGLPLGTRL